jgi:putative oxidoreductase
MIETRSRQPELLFPQLAPFYAAVSDLWYPMIRIVFGGRLFMHGLKKIAAGVAGVTFYFSKNGFEPAIVFAYTAILLEIVGGFCVALGLFTRFFAAALAVELGIAFLFINFSNGFFSGAYEFLLGIVLFAITLHGGGSYSIDRAIGREL